MANEVQAVYSSGATLYFQIRNAAGQIWNTVGLVFESFSAGSYSQYGTAMTEQTGSGFYTGTFPAGIIVSGQFSVTALQQIGGSASITDPVVAEGNFQWNGVSQVSLPDLATSGQISQMSPIRIARGVQILNFPVYLVSSADGKTPLTSGVVSGSISRDGGAFGRFQSGAFVEIGLGTYVLQAITSGDILCNTAMMIFTANGISGGSAIPRPMSVITQRVSGSI